MKYGTIVCLFCSGLMAFGYNTDFSGVQVFNQGCTDDTVIGHMYWSSVNGGGPQTINFPPQNVPPGQTISYTYQGGGDTWPSDAGGPTYAYFTDTKGYVSGQPPIRVKSPADSGSALTVEAYGSITVGTNCPDCTVSVSVSLNDSWTNQILVTFSNSDHAISPALFKGPLVNYAFNVGTFPCNNTNVSCTYSNLASCVTNLTWDVQNNSSVWRYMAVGDSTDSQTPYFGGAMVNPGGFYYYSGPFPCDRANDYHLFASDYNGGNEIMDTGIPPVAPHAGTNDLGFYIGTDPQGQGLTNAAPPIWQSSMTAQVTNNPPQLNNKTNWFLPVTTNAPSDIVWSNTNSDWTAVTAAVKDSGNVIYKTEAAAMTQAHSDAATAAAQAHTDAAAGQAQGAADSQAIVSAINQGTATAAGNGAVAHTDSSRIQSALNPLAGISNLNMEVTQQKVLAANLGTSNAVAGVNNTAAGISNLVARLATNSVDMSGTNHGNYTIYASMTNASAAQAEAGAAMDQTGVSGLIAGAVPQLPPDSVGSPGMTMEFCGRQIDLDPVHMFPNVAAVSYNGFKLAALLAFFLAAGRLYWNLIFVKATAQTGGAPDMNVDILGNGGNVLGLIAGRLVALAFIALFAAASAYIFSNIGVSIADAMAVTTFTSPMSQLSLYLLTSFFPVRLMFSLACTLIILHFALGKLVELAVGAARFLIGR